VAENDTESHTNSYHDTTPWPKIGNSRSNSTPRPTRPSHGATSWQSQMYKSAFVNHDKTYNCSEQFFHCAKAHPS
jgi:hypothetical protein